MAANADAPVRVSDAERAQRSEEAVNNWHQALKLSRLRRAEAHISKTTVNSSLALWLHFGFILLLYVVIVHTIPISDLSQTKLGLSNFLENTVQYSHLNGESGSLESVGTLDDVVAYSESLVTALLGDASYHADGRADDEHLMLLRVHRLINSVVLLQRRVAPSDCSYDVMKPLYKKCYEELDDHELTSGKMELKNGLEVLYDDALGGFAVELPLAKEEALERIKELKEGLYWDRATRESVVLFALHNSPGHYTGNVKADFMIEPYGQVRGKLVASFLRLKPYSEEVQGPFFLGLQLWTLILYLTLLGFLVRRVASQPHLRWRLAILLEPWTTLELVSHSFLIYAIILWCLYLAAPERIKVDFSSPHYQNILKLGDLFQNFIFFTTAAMLLWTVRLIQFFQHFESKQAKKTAAIIEKIFANMGYFSMILFLVFVGFVCSSHILFGPHIERFKDIFNASGTLLVWFVALSGGQREMFNYEGGPFFLFTFILIVMVLLFNLFIALVMSAHDEAIAEAEEDEEHGTGEKDLKKPWNHALADKIGDLLGMPKFRLDPFNDKALLATPSLHPFPSAASVARKDSGMAGATSRALDVRRGKSDSDYGSVRR